MKTILINFSFLFFFSVIVKADILKPTPPPAPIVEDVAGFPYKKVYYKAGSGIQIPPSPLATAPIEYVRWYFQDSPTGEDRRFPISLLANSNETNYIIVKSSKKIYIRAIQLDSISTIPYNNWSPATEVNIIINNQPLTPPTIFNGASRKYYKCDYTVSINESTANSARWYNSPFDIGVVDYIHQGLTLPKSINVDVNNLYVSSYNSITGYESARTKFVINNENLIIENIIKAAGVKNGCDLLNASLHEINQSVTYFDGMSRPMQKVMVEASPSQKDIISVTMLSPYGKNIKSFLPYSISNNFNNYRSSFEQECKAFYNTLTNVSQQTNFPYSEKKYEANRLGRLKESSNAGDVWKLGTQHTLQNSYRFNILNEVRKYQLIGTNYQVNGYYDPATIKVEHLQDENGNYSLIYTDIFGRVICKSKKNENAWISTYDIYDDNGNLIYVIQPEGMSFNELTPEVISKYVFAYEYDDEGRVIVKKIPGKGSEYFIYNDKDQLTLSQDANLRSDNAAKWKFFKYDVLGRLAYTGITVIPSYSSAQNLQNTVSAIVDPNQLVVNREELGFGYTNTIFPIVQESEITNITFYDTYSNFPIASSYGNPTGYNLAINGQISKQVKRKIDENGVIDNTNWYNTYFYYDDKYKILKTIEEQDGFVVITNNSYDFVGNILTTSKAIKNHTNAAENVTVLKSYSYDHQNRLLSVSEKINNLPTTILLNNVYDELGKLVKVNKNMVDNKPLFTTEYEYNIRDWQTKINAYWAKTLTNCEIYYLFNPADAISRINISEADNSYYNSLESSTANVVFADYTADQYVNSLEAYGFSESNFYDVFLVTPETSDLTNKEIFKAQVSLALQEQLTLEYPEQSIPSIEFNKVNNSYLFKLNQINENKIIPVVRYTNCYTTENRYNLFNQEMLYESTSNHTNTPAQFNGNISTIRWKTGSDAVREYGHHYDALNRLTASDYTSLVGSTWVNNTDYDVNSITYDNNGNMQSMTQYGKVDLSTYNKIDQLSYTYEGNRLVSVSDAIAPNASRGDFSDGANLTTEYLYDANGNMIEDKNKGITVLYNYLNMPSKVTFANGNRISYIYDTNGNKQRMIVTRNIGNAITQNITDYVNGFVYVDNTLSFFANETGRVLKTASGFQTEYVINDHLGNARVTVVSQENNEPAIIQYDSYYPFGLEMGGLSYVSSTENNYKYNGKEKQDALGLNWYDYGARFYDLQIDRFNVIDRYSEKYPNLTTYQYGANNPIKTIDINGDSLMDITLRGMDSKSPQLGQKQYYVDSEIGYQMKSFAESAMEQFGGLSVNNIYRSYSSSEINTNNTKAKGLSRHQGGFAVDFNGVKRLSKDQLMQLNELAKENGLAPLINQANDPPHFDADPMKHGYKSLKESVIENKAHYDDIKKGKAEPIKFDQKKYDEYKKKKVDENY